MYWFLIFQYQIRHFEHLKSIVMWNGRDTVSQGVGGTAESFYLKFHWKCWHPKLFPHCYDCSQYPQTIAKMCWAAYPACSEGIGAHLSKLVNSMQIWIEAATVRICSKFCICSIECLLNKHCQGLIVWTVCFWGSDFVLFWNLVNVFPFLVYLSHVLIHSCARSSCCLVSALQHFIPSWVS